MIFDNSYPSGRTVFCDDIRQEMGGKITLVGVYTGQLEIFSDGPAIVPQICLSITFRHRPDEKPDSILFKLIKSTLADEETLVEIPTSLIDTPGPLDLPPLGRMDGEPFNEMRLDLKLNAFQIAESCLLKSRIYVGDDEVLCGALRVVQSPAAAAPIQ